MTSLIPQNLSIEPRSSTETDRRHLLADSVAPSESASMVNFRLSEDDDHHHDGDRTPRARSPARPPPPSYETIQSSSSSFPASKIPAGSSSSSSSAERRGTLATPSPQPQPYRGFPSEAHYMAALHAWAEDRKYLEHDKTLVGFYGDKTMQEYIDRAPPRGEGLGLRKAWRARREARRESKGKIPALGGGELGGGGGGAAEGVAQQQARRNTVV